MPQPIIDQAVFRELQETAGADFVAELLGTFLEEAPQMIEEIRRAQLAGAAESLRRAAHSLKSNANTFGALQLGALARELELGTLPADATALDRLQAEFERAAAALEELGHG